jgi:hypothetical protein
MIDSLQGRRPGLKSPAQLRNLLLGQGPGRKLFQRAESDAVSLTQGTVDGAGFGHAHLGVVEDQGRDVAGMSVTVADEAPALGRLVHRGLEDPEVLLGAAQVDYWIDVDPDTTSLSRQSEQFGMGNLPVRFVQRLSLVTHVGSPDPPDNFGQCLPNCVSQYIYGKTSCQVFFRLW